MKIAVIPARGGSKRIPRKNIKLFDGNPMISYAINAAINSNLFEHVVVSTDDDEIAQIARECGAETPFIRPSELANDTTPTVPVVAHAIGACIEIGWSPEYVCCIYPGVPLVQVADLEGALRCLKECNAEACYPVAEFPSSPQRALKRTDKGIMEFVYPQFKMTRTQDLEQAYYDAGQFYWRKTSAWLGQNNTDGIGYIIPSWRVIDIDTPEDWKRAEIYFQVINQSPQGFE